MSGWVGDLPGNGFAPEDGVELLASSGALMGALRGPDGEWLITPVPKPVGADGLTGAGQTVVIIDTGVCDDHPALRGRVVEKLDLTGEGVDDENGHGTAVAAILAVHSPGVQIVSLKALDREGACSVGRLALGLVLAGRTLTEKYGGRGLINLSAGRRSPSCNSDCPLCHAVQALDRDGFVTVCAAGNSPGVVYCPARSGIAVGAPFSWSPTSADTVVAPPGWARL